MMGKGSKGPCLRAWWWRLQDGMEVMSGGLPVEDEEVEALLEQVRGRE